MVMHFALDSFGSSASTMALRMSERVCRRHREVAALDRERVPMLPPSYSRPEDHGSLLGFDLHEHPDMSTFQVTESKTKNSGSGPK